MLLGECKRRNNKAKGCGRGGELKIIRGCSSAGAEYVILPEKVSGDFLAISFKSNWPEVHFNGGLKVKN